MARRVPRRPAGPPASDPSSTDQRRDAAPIGEQVQRRLAQRHGDPSDLTLGEVMQVVDEERRRELSAPLPDEAMSPALAADDHVIFDGGCGPFPRGRVVALADVREAARHGAHARARIAMAKGMILGSLILGTLVFFTGGRRGSSYGERTSSQSMSKAVLVGLPTLFAVTTGLMWWWRTARNGLPTSEIDAILFRLHAEGHMRWPDEPARPQPAKRIKRRLKL